VVGGAAPAIPQHRVIPANAGIQDTGARGNSAFRVQRWTRRRLGYALVCALDTGVCRNDGVPRRLACH